MQKILLKDLKDKVFKRSALIPVNHLSRLFKFSTEFSGDEILAEIFRLSLSKFEYYHPLILDISIYYLENSTKRLGYYEMVDNFKLFLENRLDENRISLIPNSVIGIKVQGGYTTPGSYYRATDYDKPYIQVAWSTGEYVVRGLCSRPLIESYNPDLTFDDKAAIYWMDFNGVLGKVFVDQVLCDVLDYVRNLKANLRLPNMPVEIFDAVDTAYQQLKMDLDQYYLQSNWRGELLI